MAKQSNSASKGRYIIVLKTEQSVPHAKIFRKDFEGQQKVLKTYGIGSLHGYSAHLNDSVRDKILEDPRVCSLLNLT